MCEEAHAKLDLMDGSHFGLRIELLAVGGEMWQASANEKKRKRNKAKLKTF